MAYILSKTLVMRQILIRIILLSMMLISFIPSVFALNEGLQCVPYARAVSGVEIYGDAHTWWGKAKGRYERGSKPRIGAIMSFKSHGASRLGHISAVRAVVDDRTILVSHANWSRINGTRGHIEDDVQIVDVSRKNDWSRVKVWYQPIGALGGTVYPINGFIYPKKRKSYSAVKASIAKLTGRPISKVALTERPNLGKVQQKDNRRIVRLASWQNVENKPAKRRNDFNLGRSFLNDLDKKSQQEKENSVKKLQTLDAQSHDPIGGLLGKVSR